MIIGKNSALKGFALFFILIIAIVTSIFAFCYVPYMVSGKGLAITAGLLNIAIAGYFTYRKYIQWSNSNNAKTN
jgi:hypothetical protein